jgi:hypothetical protein
MSPTYRYTFLNEYKMHRDLYRLGGHSKSFGQTKTTTSGEEERINIKPRIITVLRSVLLQINEIVAWEHIHSEMEF